MIARDGPRTRPEPGDRLGLDLPEEGDGDVTVTTAKSLTMSSNSLVEFKDTTLCGRDDEADDHDDGGEVPSFSTTVRTLFG